jgi:hypothetical protein
VPYGKGCFPSAIAEDVISSPQDHFLIRHLAALTFEAWK